MLYRPNNQIPRENAPLPEVSRVTRPEIGTLGDRQSLSAGAQFAFDLLNCVRAFGGDDRSTTLVERMGTPTTRIPSEMEWPPVVPLLGKLVNGAEKCAVFLFDSTGGQLRLTAAANLSLEFVNALTNDSDVGRLVTLAAQQAEPYVIIYSTDKGEFGPLRRLAQKERLRTLWLVPWHDRDGALLGALLFASANFFSPGEEAIASVRLLTALMSLVLPRTRGNQENGEFADELDSGGTGNGTTNVQPISRELSRIWQNQIPDAVLPPILEDQHGAPVLYDSSLPQQNTKPDAISVLSHELLSPLTIIKGYASTLLQLNSVIAEEQKAQYLHGIESATNRVIGLLENLRDITRLEECNTLATETICVPDLLRQTVLDAQSQTTKHVIKLRLHGRLPSVQVDQQKIEQVMSNLIGNALKYSPDGGDIEVAARLIRDENELREICSNAPKMLLPCVMVSVSDSGIGVPEEELDKIFERFYRVNNRQTRTIRGAGLGLYICNMIIEAHGGRIWARSKPYGGSIFSFTLPIDRN